MNEVLMDLIIDAAVDTIKLIPFLFLTYLAMEYLEHKAGKKTVAMLLNTGKRGPVIGGILGVVPQCGFSAAAANLYSGGVITVGTMIAVFLSTSDEMLPILISGRAEMGVIGLIILAKVVVGVIAGILVDWAVRIYNYGYQRGLHIKEICERDHCHEEQGNLVYSAFLHSLQIVAFIFVITLVLNVGVEAVGMKALINGVARYPIKSIFITAFVGLIPNCAASVAITTFYLEGVLSAGSMFAGLLSCAGIGILVLFRTHRNWKVNLLILGTVYAISVVCGILIEVIL